MNQKPEASNLASLRELIKNGKDNTDKSILDGLQARRKLIADYYYDKDVPKNDRQEFYEELKLLHAFLGYKEIFPLIKKDGSGGRRERSIQEKKDDINAMFEFCWKKAFDEGLKIVPKVGNGATDLDKKERDILISVLFKAFVRNWTA